jgi:hypothetical protein
MSLKFNNSLNFVNPAACFRIENLCNAFKTQN